MRLITILLFAFAGCAVEEDRSEVQECWDYHNDIMDRISAVPNIYVQPCVACILDRSETPYCKNLCGPTPYEEEP